MISDPVWFSLSVSGFIFEMYYFKFTRNNTLGLNLQFSEMSILLVLTFNSMVYLLKFILDSTSDNISYSENEGIIIKKN